MHRITLHRHALVALVVAVVPALAGAAPLPPGAADNDVAPAAKVKAQLDQTITLEIADQPLSAALNTLRNKAKLNFVVDRLTIQQMGLDPDQMLVSAHLKDAKTRTALRAILGPSNLGFVIIGDTVLISSDDVAIQRQLKQRVNVDVEKVDLAAALKKLSKDTAANVVLDSRVADKLAKTEVTLQMDDVSLETAVRLIAEGAGLKPVKVGNVLMVTTKAVAAEMRKDAEPQPQVVNAAFETDGLALFNGRNVRVWQAGGMIMRGGGGFINPNTGDIMPQGTAVPPLDKPPDKDADALDEPAPAKDKKADK